MERKEYEKIVKKHFAFTLKKDLKPKQISNIIKYISPDLKENDIIGFDDTGLMKNGKSGFLITKTDFYDSSHKVKIPFKGLTDITYKNEGSVTVQATFHYVDGSTLTDKVIIARPEELIEILLEIAKQYNMDKNVEFSAKKQEADDSEGKKLVLGGWEYITGEHVSRNYQTALNCFRVAAQKNYAPAYFYIGLCYKEGYGVEKNNEKACAEFEKGASLNEIRAISELIEGTAQGIYMPSKEMLQKLLEYGKTELKDDDYLKQFLKRIEDIIHTEGKLEDWKCFTYDDLKDTIKCPYCGKELYPAPGHLQVYCTLCGATVKAEQVKKEPAKKEAAKAEIVKKEPAKKETVKAEPKKKDPVKKETEYEKARKANLEQALKRTQNDLQNDLYEQALHQWRNRNYDKARNMFWESAKAGHEDSIKWIGKNSWRKYPEIVKMLDVLAKKGDLDAIGIIGYIYMESGQLIDAKELLKKAENTKDEFLQFRMVDYYLKGLVSFSSKGYQNLDTYMQSHKSNPNYNEWVYWTRNIQKDEHVHAVAKKYANSYDQDKNKKVFDLYKLLAERNTHLYIVNKVKQLIEDEKKDELIVMVELQYARANMVSAVEAKNHREYESAYEYYKEAYEDAQLVKRYRSIFADNKQALPENEIRKQATCEIAHLYVEGKLGRFHDKGAKEWCKDAADLYNDSASLYFLAQANKGTPGMHLSWLEKAAKAGYAPAVKEWKEGEKSNWKNSDVFTRKRYYIDDSCINCCECLDVCEEFGAIDYLEHVCIDDNYCTGCGKCAEYCQKIGVGAIKERR